MQPAGSENTAAENVEASAEATLAAAAITLETVQTAIETEAETAEDRQEELLAEVRKCLAKLEALSSSMERGAESPSLQQLLMQVGQMQGSLEKIQVDLSDLREESSHSSLEGAGQGDLADEARNTEEVDGPQSAALPPQNRPKSTSPNSDESNRPKSSQSATPASKKRHYVKI
jgi:hypothetical protein